MEKFFGAAPREETFGRGATEQRRFTVRPIRRFELRRFRTPLPGFGHAEARHWLEKRRGSSSAGSGKEQFPPQWIGTVAACRLPPNRAGGCAPATPHLRGHFSAGRAERAPMRRPARVLACASAEFRCASNHSTRRSRLLNGRTVPSIQSSHLGACGGLTTRPSGRASLAISAISASVSAKSKTPMFSARRSRFDVRGMTASPSWIR
jgi:hypothetical protein